ncbi:hydroxymethylbilane synthase [Rathayibacter soli]|uniref:hydroxymethylbilane synthase n=1 Tax=Rathayibacter soli TaxID=3144168 RepID=UPI0027E5AFFD|nr:hydroxymethylbilane synthase [Glaciibacter superstes]
MTNALRIGTRGSELALAQTRAIAKSLGAASGLEVEIVTVTTHGDTSRESLSALGGTGVFASALRDALLDGRCDAVVHSLKDLPTVAVPGLTIGAIPRRADARDVLCARDTLTLHTLPSGARVGTGSPRRIAQLRQARPDVEVIDIRGNVDTRLNRVFGVDATDADALDAIILAAAGLGRLGRAEAATDMFSLSDWPTAPGQGALAIEVRDADAHGRGALAAALASVNHVTTNACASAERLVLAGLDAGCSAPIGTTAQFDDGLFFLTATVYKPDGTQRITSSHAATPDATTLTALLDTAREVSERVVAELLEAGAGELAPSLSSAPRPPSAPGTPGNAS